MQGSLLLLISRIRASDPKLEALFGSRFCSTSCRWREVQRASPRALPLLLRALQEDRGCWWWVGGLVGGLVGDAYSAVLAPLVSYKGKSLVGEYARCAQL